MQVVSVNKPLADRAKNRFQGRKARGILGYERSKFLPFGCGRWLIFGKKSVKIEKKNYVDMIGYTFDGSCLDYFEYYISCFVPDTSFYTYPDYEKMFDLKGISKFNYSQWNPTPIEKENQHYGMVQYLTHIGNLMNNKKTAKFVDDDLINKIKYIFKRNFS